MFIRNYSPSDYQMLCDWWKIYCEPAPYPACMPEESSFVLEINNVPAYALTVLLTNSKEYAYLENFVGNPLINNKEGAQMIANYAYSFAKDKGYKRVIAFCYKDKLKKRYEELGVIKTLDNLSSFVRSL